MLAYNDIEKINEFTTHQIRMSRPPNSKHQKDHNKNKLSTRQSNSNYSGNGKLSLKGLYKQNSFTDETTSSACGMNSKLLQF